jgi:hypothetical protein
MAPRGCEHPDNHRLEDGRDRDHQPRRKSPVVRPAARSVSASPESWLVVVTLLASEAGATAEAATTTKTTRAPRRLRC